MASVSYMTLSRSLRTNAMLATRILLLRQWSSIVHYGKCAWRRARENCSCQQMSSYLPGSWAAVQRGTARQASEDKDPQQAAERHHQERKEEVVAAGFPSDCDRSLLLC
jgi:hypothetical protein